MSHASLHRTVEPVNLVVAYSAICVLVAAAGLWSVYEPFGRDQGIHASIAFALREGIPTYDGVFNLKPPMTTAAHLVSQVLFGHHMGAIRIFDLLVTAFAACALMRLLMLLGFGFGPVLLATATFIGHYYHLDFWHRAQTDGWAGFLTAFALALMVSGWTKGGGWKFFLAGVALAVAFALKYTIAGVGLAIFAPLLVRSAEVRFRLTDFAVFVAGGLAMLGAIGAIMALRGTLPAYVEIQTYIFSYATGWRIEASTMAAKFWLALSQSPVGSFFAVPTLAVLAARLIRRDRGLAEVLLALWILAGVLSFWSQGKGIAYHGLPLILALSASTAVLWQTCGDFLRDRISAKGLVVLATILAVTLVGLRPVTMTASAGIAFARGDRPVLPSDFFDVSDFSVAANAAAAERLNELLEPDETIFVWGYETMLYFTSKRPPAHRYPYAWPFVVTFHDGRYTGDLMARLEAAPPDVFVVQSRDATPWVTGETRDSKAMLPEVPELQDFLTARYRQVDAVERFEFWRRID